MKIIDKTPLIDQEGKLGFTQRIQGMFKYGLGWLDELEAQKAVLTFLDKNLEKGYTLIRNMTLGKSGIMIPFILIGPAGIFVLNQTFLRGRYQAVGDAWNVESGAQYKPAPVNLIRETARMARALQVFIERQGTKLPVDVEPVLIAGDPGLHIESSRPVIKVLMIDAVKSFVTGLTTGAPVLTALAVNEAVDRILEPRPPRREPVSHPVKPAVREPEPPPEPVSRARAIFSAAEEPKPFNPSEFDFAMVDERSATEAAKAFAAAPEPRKAGRRILGLTTIQLVILAALASCLICVIVLAFVFVIPAVS